MDLTFVKTINHTSIVRIYVYFIDLNDRQIIYNNELIKHYILTQNFKIMSIIFV